MASKKKHSKLGKATRALCILASVLVIFPCIAVAVFGVLDLAEILPFLSGTVNSYRICYFEKDSETEEMTIFYDYTIKRGEKLREYNEIPVKEGYKFIGWDIDYNGTVDVIPLRAYNNIYAQPVWFLVDLDIVKGDKK